MCRSTNGSLLWLLGSVLASTRRSAGNTTLVLLAFRFLGIVIFADCKTYQIQSSSNQMISHTGTILRSTAPNEHNTMLLDIMSLARDIRRNNRPGRQLDTSSLSLSRVGLLGSHDTDTEAYAFQCGTMRVCEGGGHGVTSALALSNAAEDLVEGCWSGSGC